VHNRRAGLGAAREECVQVHRVAVAGNCGKADLVRGRKAPLAQNVKWHRLAPRMVEKALAIPAGSKNPEMICGDAREITQPPLPAQMRR